jgi:hypothetical protein
MIPPNWADGKPPLVEWPCQTLRMTNRHIVSGTIMVLLSSTLNQWYLINHKIRRGAMVETPIKMTGELEFHFEKANAFRVIHVDGAYGGISPGNRMIHMAVFSERTPLPKLVVHAVADGILGVEIPEKRITKSGIFREVEADLVMSLDIAISIRDWLNARIEETQTLVAMLPGGSQ